MQSEISQSRQFKYSIVYVVKDAISYNCFTAIMQHFVVKNCFYFKTPDGAASISSSSYLEVLFWRAKWFVFHLTDVNLCTTVAWIA